MTSQHSSPDDPELADRFPGWQIEQGADGMLHAWLIGTEPP
jgi:hypothetical protein